MIRLAFKINKNHQKGKNSKKKIFIKETLSNSILKWTRNAILRINQSFKLKCNNKRIASNILLFKTNKMNKIISNKHYYNHNYLRWFLLLKNKTLYSKRTIIQTNKLIRILFYKFKMIKNIRKYHKNNHNNSNKIFLFQLNHLSNSHNKSLKK